MFKQLFLLFSLISLGLSFPANVLPPSQDPFYSAPEGFESAELGAILKSRVTPAPIRSIHFEVKVKNAWQLLVRSSDSFGNPSVIVTTVFEPYNADASKIVSYQVAQDSASNDCSPSYAFLNGGGFSTITSQAEMILIQTALDQGYYVVSPDYEGLKAVYTGGIQSGHGTLDSLTAALASKNVTGLNTDAKIVLWGYSGGALAAGWAAALQPSYAPALKPNLLGAAIGGFVTNITATVTSVNGGPFSGLVGMGIAGLSNEYPELKEYLKEQMYPDRYEKFQEIYGLCTAAGSTKFAFTNWFNGPFKYVNGIGVLANEPAASILTENTLGVNPSQVPEIPIFVYHGVIDSLVPYKETERVYKAWCDEGIESFELAADLTAGHLTEVVQGSGAAFGWIKKRFDGKAPISGCKKTKRLTNLLYPGTVVSVTNVLGALFANVLGQNIGPNGENMKSGTSALSDFFN